MMRLKRNPESGKKLQYDGPAGELGYDILLEAKDSRNRGVGIIVYVLDNYNQYSSHTKTFADTKDGYAEAKAYFTKLAAYGWRLPVRCRMPETLPEGLFD